MAYLDNTRDSISSPWRFTLCLTSEECKLLLPEFKSSLRRETRRYEKYKDIHESGDATEKQQNLLCDAENKVDCLIAVIYQCEELIKRD